MKIQEKDFFQPKNPIDPDNFNSISDEEIVAKVIAGKSNLFEVLVRRHNQQLFRIVRSYITDEEDVKDVMQTAYLKAYDKLHQFRSEAKFSTWLIRIAINEALKLLKKKKKISEVETVTDTADKDQINRSVTSDPETNVIQSDMNEYVERAIDRLPLPYRRVFIMREIEQMSTKETAKCLEITRVNVKVRLHRAKGMLKKELLDMVGNTEVFRFKGERCDAMTQSVMSKINSRDLPS